MGKQQTGNYKLDARFNKPKLIVRFRPSVRYKDRINLYNLDAAEIITTMPPRLPATIFVYFDPPNYVKGKELYNNHKNHQDHANIFVKEFLYQFNNSSC